MPSASDVVTAIHDDLFGRAGFDAFWDEISADVREEIFKAHTVIVERALEAEASAASNANYIS